MKSSFKDQGIIIKIIDFGEADKLLNILTEKHGLVELVAKGARRLTSRKAPHLDLLNLIKFQANRGRPPQIIVQAEVIKPFANLKKDIKLTRTCFYVTEVLNRMLALDEPDLSLFLSLNNYLTKLNTISSDKTSRQLSTKFQLYLLKHLGFPLPKDDNPQTMIKHIEGIISKKIKSSSLKL